MKSLLSLITLLSLVLFTGCNQKESQIIPVQSVPEVQTEAPTAKPDPVMKEFTPVGEELTQALGAAGISAAKGRFEMPDLRLSGPGKREFTLSAQKGKVVFLNLWATWCPPCRKEMPTMQTLYKKMQNRPFVMAAVSIGEEPGTVSDFMGENPYTFPIYWDPDNSSTKDLSTGSIPTTYIVAKDGKLVGRLVGATDWNAPALDRVWDLLLKE